MRPADSSVFLKFLILQSLVFINQVWASGDVDECVQSLDICQFGGVCQNTVGSFACSCPAGFLSGANVVCEDIDECQTSPCGEAQAVDQCINLDGSWSCQCNQGYQGGEQTACANIDECANDPGICIHGNCSDLPGPLLFLCDCDPGYDTSGVGQPCDIVNECEVQPCGNNWVQCDELDPGFQCTCQLGYSAEFFSECEDIDECATSDFCGDSSIVANCVNLEGTFRCDCAQGYTGGIGQTCVETDECSENSLSDICGTNSTGCVNSIGSFQCHCATGFNATEASPCEDIDECDWVDCGDTGTCVNVEGSFLCDCFVGYDTEEGSMFCVDVDECEDMDLSCGDEGVTNCSNTVGSYLCDCGSTGHWPGRGSECQYDRVLELMVSVEEVWSTELLDQSSDTYVYFTSNIEQQMEDTLKSSSLADNLVSVEVIGISTIDFIVYQDLTLTDIPNSLTDSEIIAEIQSNFVQQPDDIALAIDTLQVVTLASGSVQSESGESSNAVILGCQVGGMKIDVPITPELNYARLSLLDNSCELNETADGFYYSVYFDYPGCSAVRNSDNDSIIYTQYVLINDSLDEFDSGQQSFRSVSHSSILAVLKCEYKKDALIFNSGLNDGDMPTVSGSGSFDVRLLMYTDETYSQHHTESPVPVSVGDQLYFGAALTSTTLRLTLQSCWISDVGNVYSPNRNYIMQDYCPVDDAFSYYSASRQDWFVPFTYEAQVIINSRGQPLENVFYICQYSVCDMQSNQPCPDETNSCVARRRRSVGIDASFSNGLVTMQIKFGDFQVRKASTAPDTQGDFDGDAVVEEAVAEEAVVQLASVDETSAPLVASLAITSVCLVAIVAGLAFWKFRSKWVAKSETVAVTNINSAKPGAWGNAAVGNERVNKKYAPR